MKSKIAARNIQTMGRERCEIDSMKSEIATRNIQTMGRERCKIHRMKSEIATRNIQTMERERCKIHSTKSETSPFVNPVSACGAGDAGVENAPYGFDPSGVAQRGNSRLYGGERVCRICGIGVRVVRKGRKRGQEREILGYVQR